MKGKIVLQDPDKTEIIHITSVEVNHTDLHDYPVYAAKLKKILTINLRNVMEFPYMVIDKFQEQITDILNQLYNLNVKYAVIWSDGSWPDSFEFEEKLEEYIQEWNKTDWLAAGHIIAYPGKLPKWHQQCVVINLENFSKLGLKSIDGFWKDYPSYQQSPDHHHDDYTPLWIGPQQLDLGGEMITVPIDDIDYTPDNILNTIIPYAIYNGMIVYNLPQDLRDQKTCCYPEDEIEHTIGWFLNKNFPNNLTVPELEVFNDEIHEDKQSLKQFKIMNTEIVYITNTESVPKIVDIEADVISAPCSGLHQFKYASNNLKTLKRMVWFDFSPLGIAWTKKLLEEWDGRNFCQYFEENQEWLYIISHAYSKFPEDIKILYDPELAQEFVESYGGEDQWVEIWNQIRELKHDFIQVDLINDWQQLVDEIGKNDRLFLQVSNIWQYEINYVNNDIIDAELAFANLLKELTINNNKVYLTGDTPNDDHYSYTDVDILAEIL